MTTDSREEVIVAVKADKVIPKTALAWALTHVVRPGDHITLLAVLPQRKNGRRTLWGFRRSKGDCQAAESTDSPDRMVQISESCSQMVLQFHNQIDVRVRIKVMSATSAGLVASEAKTKGTKWVILDK